MERERRIINQENSGRNGVSLGDLVKPEVERRRHAPGMKVSERIIWLSESIESEWFWDSLSNLIEKDNSKRHSLGGIFTRELGKERLGPYTFQECIKSLDVFLRPFEFRATEFIFRDFKPKRKEIEERVEEVRRKAFDKYPRVRRLYWDDYMDLLNGPLFWRNIFLDLQELSKPVSYDDFFGWPIDIKKSSKTHVEQSLNKLFWYYQGQPARAARSLQYRNLAQIVRDIFHIDARTFLLRYHPGSGYQNLFSDIGRAKNLIERKILASRTNKKLRLLNLREFEKEITSRTFWRQLIEDLEKYRESDEKTPTSSYFIRYFDRDEGRIIPNRNGNYVDFATVFIRSKKGARKKMPSVAARLSDFLMWKFQPLSEDLKDLVLRAKELCSELFPQDCLYVALQTPRFWHELSEDLKSTKGGRNFYSFLRYFSSNNLFCDSRKHKRGEAKYQRYLHRAYHKQEEFNRFLTYLKIGGSKDYNDGLLKLFWTYAPDEVRGLLQKKFPTDFDPKRNEKRRRQRELLEVARAKLEEMIDRYMTQDSLQAETVKNAKEIQRKIWSAARTLGINVSTNINGTVLLIELRRRRVGGKMKEKRLKI